MATEKGMVGTPGRVTWWLEDLRYRAMDRAAASDRWVTDQRPVRSIGESAEHGLDRSPALDPTQ
jgi:hypothetical protein